MAALVTWSVPEGLHLVGVIHARAIHQELQPMGTTHTGVVHGRLSAVGGNPYWSRRRV